MTASGPGNAIPPVVDRLLESSRFFARSAVAAYAAESWQVFHLHLATAVELLVKAVLANSHPSFIADPRADFDSLLHLTGFGHHAKRPEFAVRTISVKEAIDRLERVVSDYRPPGRRVALLLETRNSIVHLGHQSRAEGEAILGEAAEFVGAMLPSLDLTPVAYWGESVDLVADHAKRRLSAIEADYRRRIQAAKDRFGVTVSTMDAPTRAAYLAAVAPPGVSEPFDRALVECPACGQLGALTGTPEPDWEPDFDVEGGFAYVAGMYVGSIQLTPTGFSCPTCGLKLDDSLVTIAEFDNVILKADDFDVTEATAFFERQSADEEWLG